MMYLQPSYVHGMTPDDWGLLNTDAGSMAARHLAVYKHAFDNRAFHNKFDPERFYPFLAKMRIYQANNLFVACPDVVRDCAGTLALFDQHAPQIAALGYTVALVAQDGLERVRDWPPAGALFVGGSDDWKESPETDMCIRRAKALGWWVHIGRVNSKRRFDHFQLVGADSCDGTFVKFGGQANWRRMRHWPAQRPLFRLES